MLPPPDPEMRRPATRQSDRAKIAKFQHRKLYHISPVQALIALLAPLWFVLLLLTIAGGLSR
jgi:hypothetical protein